MKAFQFEISGRWGHFKKPETNNNPLTHDIIPKTALIGLIGSVLGIERQEMKNLFPVLSDNLLYSVQLLNAVKKVSWGFSSRTAINPSDAGSPKYFEFLSNPHFKVILTLKNDSSKIIFNQFLEAIKEEESVYTPVLGWHNCPANLKFLSEGTISSKQNNTFTTYSFVSSEHKPSLSEFRVGFDKLPTFQTNDFWNLPEKYKQIIYPDFPYKLIVEGDYFEYLNTKNEIETIWLM